MVFNLSLNTPSYDLQIAGYPGATVTVTNGKKTFQKSTDTSGKAVFEKLKKGIWSVVAAAGSEQQSYTVPIGRNNPNSLNINAIPNFSYTGLFEIVNDSDVQITSAIKNWKIRFLTSGILTFNALTEAVIDVFCVGAGGKGGNGAYYNDGTTSPGGGGGGGYTTTVKAFTITHDVPYSIVIGAGNGETTYAFNNAIVANGGGSGGGHNGITHIGSFGGDGGSGGGSGYKNGGSDGSNGETLNSNWPGGKGQGSTTREFGEPTGKLYADGGGGGGSSSTGSNGQPNTGNGGGGGGTGGGGAGGSGIVIIRNGR